MSPDGRRATAQSRSEAAIGPGGRGGWLARGITDVFADVAGSRARPVTWVVIQDVGTGQWTMGGDPVTTEGVKELLRGEPAGV